MAPPITGTWRRTFVGQQGAQVWGTGVNTVHYYYGSDPLRLKEYNRQIGEVTPAFEGVPERIEARELWGYQPEDSLYTTLVRDDRPDWTEVTEDTKLRRDTGDQPAYSAPGYVNERFRRIFGGAYRNFRGAMTTEDKSSGDLSVGYVQPTETVSEGWINKPKGIPADAKPSDDSQLIMQTSMIQRYKTRNNRASVIRGTDEPRADIPSKVTGQRLKVYSGDQRHYDMFPFQQDQMPRPFWYRTAATGRTQDMLPNTLYSIQAIERIPPGDPSQGPPETSLTNEYGYTSEDAQYYA